MPTMVQVICANPKCLRQFKVTLQHFNKCQKNGNRMHCSKQCGISHQVSRQQGKAWGTGVRDEFTSVKRFLRLAKRRDPQTNLTLDHLKEIWVKQQGKCPYTGWDLILPQNQGGFGDFSGAPMKASLDRINSDKGYEIGNVQFVAFMANVAKCDFTHDQMIEFCEAIARKWKTTG